MDITKLIGLAAIGYALFTNKKKTESEDDLSNLRKKYELLQDEFTETAKELEDYSGKNVKSDIEIIPQLHMDVNGGEWASKILITFKNNSTKVTYHVGNIKIDTLQCLKFRSNTFSPFLISSVTLKPGEQHTFEVWYRNYFSDQWRMDGDYASSGYDYSRVFFSDQATYFKSNFFSDINTDKTIQKFRNAVVFDNIGSACQECVYKFDGGLQIVSMEYTSYSNSDELQQKTVNNIFGDLYVYCLNSKSTGDFVDFPRMRGVYWSALTDEEREAYWDCMQYMYINNEWIELYRKDTSEARPYGYNDKDPNLTKYGMKTYKEILGIK